MKYGSWYFLRIFAGVALLGYLLFPKIQVLHDFVDDIRLGNETDEKGRDCYELYPTRQAVNDSTNSAAA